MPDALRPLCEPETEGISGGTTRSYVITIKSIMMRMTPLMNMTMMMMMTRTSMKIKIETMTTAMLVLVERRRRSNKHHLMKRGDFHKKKKE